MWKLLVLAIFLFSTPAFNQEEPEETTTISITNGESIVEVDEKFKSLTHSVKVKIVIDNHTNQLLKSPLKGNYYYGSAEYSGYLSGNAVFSALSGDRAFSTKCKCIAPGFRESAYAHKDSNTATGCGGVLVWKIGNTNKVVFVMYSMPYSFDFYSNTLAVGISDYTTGPDGNNVLPGDQNNDILFNKMYSGSGNFSRNEYYYGTKGVEFKQDGFRIQGSMGTSHDTVIYLKFSMESDPNH